MIRPPNRPPALWLALVRALLRAACRDEVEGDLIEGWRDRADATRWRRAWAFWRDALSVVVKRPGSYTVHRPDGPTRRGRWSSDWAGDVRIAWRTLNRRRGFALTAVVTLSLGLGANGAIFALAWHTSLRPLAYPEPERLIRVFESNPATGQPLAGGSPTSILAWADRARTIAALGFFGRSRVTFPEDDDGMLARYQSLSPGALAALGVRPILGRIVLTDADRRPDEVLISYEYWQRRFGGDPGVIDRLHRFAGAAGTPERIIGVMPPEFQLIDRADIWAINTLRAPRRASLRSMRQYNVLARVRPGHHIAEATAELERISAGLALEFPDTHAGWTPVVRPLHATIVGDFALVALLLLAAAGAVLLIACTNVAGLLTVRATSRRQELSMRRALGASRWRIARLWLAEGVLIALASLAVGLTTAYWVAEALRAVAPSSLPRLDQLALSGPAIGLCAAGAAAVALTYALVPLIWTGGFAHGARRDLLAHANSRLVNSGRHGRAVLLAGQAGLAAILLTYAVLFSSALERLHSEPLGFDPAGVLTVRLSPPYAGHRDPWPDAAEYGRQLEERLRQQPGVLQAAVATAIPLDEGIDPIGDPQDSGFFVVRGDPTETVWSAIWHSASAGYLETVGLTLTAGRWFDDSDAFTPAELSLRTRREFVAVVTESMARTLWPDGSAVGQRLVGVFGGGHRVVGVIRDLKFRGADEPADFRILVPWSELPHVTPAVLVKTSGDPRDLAAMVSTIARDLRPGTGVQPARTLEELYRASTADTRFATTLVGGFSALAVLLTGVGVFGLVGYAVAARRRELAVRLALGASRRGLAVTIGGSGLRPVLVGTVLGLLAAAGGVRFLRGLLFEVDPLAPGYYLLAGGLLLLVGGAASTAPLRRLLAIDPAETLRSE